MKILELVKEIWKVNKWGYLTSGIIVTLGCLFLYAKFKSPLEVMIPLGWFGLLILMYGFSFLLGDDD